MRYPLISLGRRLKPGAQDKAPIKQFLVKNNMPRDVIATFLEEHIYTNSENQIVWLHYI